MFSTDEREAVFVKEGQGAVLLCAPPPHFPGYLNTWFYPYDQTSWWHDKSHLLSQQKICPSAGCWTSFQISFLWINVASCLRPPGISTSPRSAPQTAGTTRASSPVRPSPRAFSASSSLWCPSPSVSHVIHKSVLDIQQTTERHLEASVCKELGFHVIFALSCRFSEEISCWH